MRPRLMIVPVATWLILAISGAAFAQPERAPFVSQAIDACLGGEPALDAAMSRATAAGWPTFTRRELSGREWRTSSAPADESAPIRLSMMEEGRTLRCIIASAAELHPAFAQQFERIPGSGDTRAFILDDGQIIALEAGALTVSRSAYIGEARLRHEEGRGAAITFVLTPMQ